MIGKKAPVEGSVLAIGEKQRLFSREKVGKVTGKPLTGMVCGGNA